MFKEIHKTLKLLAKISAVLGFIAILVGIIADIAAEAEGLFLGTISGGGVVLILQSWLIYGFGQLIENSQQTVDLLKQQKQTTEQNKSAAVLSDELPAL